MLAGTPGNSKEMNSYGADKISLLAAIEKISQEYEVYFTFDMTLVSDVTVEYDDWTYTSAEEAISHILEGTDLNYKFYDQRFVILYRSDAEGIESLKKMSEHLDGLINEGEQNINSSPRTMVRAIPKLPGRIPAKSINRITFSVEGKVVDQEGEPLIGVNIQVKGSNKGTATDFDGNFILEDIDENAVLVISYVGYQTQEIPISGQSNIEIVMTSDSQLLDEVVVVGYGTQKKINVIGSISTISNDEIKSSPVSRVSNSLAGRLSGAIIQQPSGEPGNDVASILLRGQSTLGNNNPLIVIDGIAERDLNSLEAGDIENISVLKDAAAAIYGARAANGVILITTKRGTKGKPQFNYNYYRGRNSPTSITKVVDAPTYAQMIREQESYEGIDEGNMMYSLEDIEKFESGEYPWTHPNTDWYKASIADYSIIENHNFNVKGGSENINYYGSFGKQTDGGIYKANATSYDRYNLRANLDVEVNKYIDLTLSIHGSQENKIYPTKSASEIFQNGIYRSKPTETAIFPNGLPGQDVEYGDQPVVTTSFETGFDDTRIYRSQNTISTNIRIPGINGLIISGDFAYDLYFSKRKLFQKPWTLYALDKNSYLADGNTGREDGSKYLNPYKTGNPEPRLTDSYENTKSITYNIKFEYNRSFNDHNFNIFAAHERFDYSSEGFGAFRRYFISDQIPYLFAGGSDDQDINSSVSIDARMNYFGRISYDYIGKYLLQFSYRRDGSLRFSEEQGRWGNFPSLLLGWRISEEKFWNDNILPIDHLKLKASWGQLGNDAVNAFQYLTNFKFSTGLVLGDSRTYKSSLDKEGNPNPFITWEVSNMYNVGFESILFNDKIIFDLEYFYERRNNILVKRNASVPSFTGLELPDENFGIVDNKGIELQLGYINSINNLNLGINGNFTYVKNKIVEFDEPEKNVEWQILTGHPIGTKLLYKWDGIYKDINDIESSPHLGAAIPGDIKILDYDGDGEITSDDRILFDKNEIPEIIFGLNLNFGYKGLNITSLVQGVANTRRQIFTAVQGKGGTYYAYEAEGRWTSDNINATKPRAFERDQPYWRSSHMTDYYYYDMSYMRLKNLEINYSIPSKFLEQIYLDNINLFISGQNLFMIYAGEGSKLMDPELTSISNYPIMRTYAMGVRIDL